MPVSQEPTHDDRELTRYLLGQLAEEDADRLDELAIVDDDMAWRVRTVENDLVDAYVRGVLDAENRQRFETHYLASPKRRAKVRFAARLARAIDALGSPEIRPERRRGSFAAGPKDERTREGGWLNWLVPQSAAGWSAVYAAAAILAIACGLLVMRDLQLGRALHESEQQRAAMDRRARELEDQLAGQRAAAAAGAAAAVPADAGRAGEQTREATRGAGTETANGASTSIANGSATDVANSSATSVANGSTPGVAKDAGSSPSSFPARGSAAAAPLALVLWPQTRGVSGSGPSTGAAAPVVAVPAGADRVMLELQLEDTDFVRYSAALKETASGLIVWRADRVAAPAPGGPPAVSIAVPASLLKPRAYALELTGYGSAGGGDVIGAYAFQVVRR